MGLALMLGLLSSCRGMAQVPVSEERMGVEQCSMPRNLLLEEFTAIHCSYCPSGHAIAQNMHRVFGNRLQTIAVHAGGLAVPGGNEPDFRTAAGADWYERQGGAGMPSGALNRHVFNGLCNTGYALGRGDWQEAARKSMGDTALVNLYIEAVLDTQTRSLTVRVEYFYPESIDMQFNTLTLAITENYVPGTQSGFTGGSQYLHRHVLRDVITPVWGDTLRDLSARRVLEKTYHYTVPAQYVNRAPALENLEVVAFMSDTMGEILNSTAARVEYKGRYAAPQLLLSTPALSRRHSHTSIPVIVENLGSETVRSLLFSIEWGNQTYTVQVDTVSIPYAEEKEINVPLDEYAFSKVLKYRITVREVNGKNVACNIVSDYITEPYIVNTDKVRFELTTDEYGEDITYTLSNRAGKIIEQGGPFESGLAKTYTAEWNLQMDSVYSLDIKDAFMDGFAGGYKLLDANGNPVVSERYVDMYGATVSFVYRKNTVANEPLLETANGLQMTIAVNPVPSTRPDNEITFVGFASGQLYLSVFDIQGHEVFNTKIKVNSHSDSARYLMDTRQFRSGFYFVKVTDGSQMVVQKMLVL